MKAKQVYDSIDQSKSTKDVNAFLEKVKAATKNFTVENESVDKKMNELYEKIKATKPDILKGSKEPKSTSAKKKVEQSSLSSSSNVLEGQLSFIELTPEAKPMKSILSSFLSKFTSSKK